MIRINNLLCIDGERGLFLNRGDLWCSGLCVRLATYVILGEEFGSWIQGAAPDLMLSELRYLRKNRCYLGLFVFSPSQGP